MLQSTSANILRVTNILLNRYSNEREEVSSRTVSGDETWGGRIHYYKARIQKAEYGVKTSWFASDKEVQNVVFHGKSNANPCLGLKRGPILEKALGKKMYN